MVINYSELRVNIFLTLGLTKGSQPPFFHHRDGSKKWAVFHPKRANIGAKNTRFWRDFPPARAGCRERKRAENGAGKRVKKEF